MNKIKRYIKTFLSTVLIIGIITMIFKGVVQIVLSTEINKLDSTDISHSSFLNLENNTEVQESYVKSNYKIIYLSEPTSLDISLEEAAEIGVQNLYLAFGVDMNDKVLEMKYTPAYPSKRPKWEGICWVNGKKESFNSMVELYSFSIDTISGEMFEINHERVLSEEDTNRDLGIRKPDGLDFSQFATKEYENLAKELSINLGAIQSKVKIAKFNDYVSFPNNDIGLYIDVTGENGEYARLAFSAYDKELIGIHYNAYIKERNTYEKTIQAFKSKYLIQKQISKS